MSGSPQDWMGYLDTASRLYRYPFSDNLLIHAQRPDAAACASLELWNHKMNRWVNRGAKGIALIDDAADLQPVLLAVASQLVEPVLRDIGQTEKTIGKYGMLRRRFLKEHRKNWYQSMILSGKLEKYPAPNKETEQMAWTAHMNGLTAMAEESILTELAYMEGDMAEGVAELVFDDLEPFRGGYPDIVEKVKKLLAQPSYLTELNECLEGKFTPAGEKERLEELQVFIKNLQIRTHLLANSASNFYPATVFLPKERHKIISELQYIVDTVSEEEMQEYRRNLHSLGSIRNYLISVAST